MTDLELKVVVELVKKAGEAGLYGCPFEMSAEEVGKAIERGVTEAVSEMSHEEYCKRIYAKQKEYEMNKKKEREEAWKKQLAHEEALMEKWHPKRREILHDSFFRGLMGWNGTTVEEIIAGG